MKISYKWLIEYLPIDEVTSQVIASPQRLSEILTSVGLEVESLEKYEEVPNDLEGLIIGEVLSCEKHPDADKLKVTTVNNGNGETLQIVCGAPNVAKGQKVILAQVGTQLFPVKGEPFTIKKAKIRGVESQGMLCAEDEIGIGNSHEGIIVLPTDAVVGVPAKDYYNLYSDWIFEIGLTPNRMDAMSHIGVAKDICAYLSHHYNKNIVPVTPFKNKFKPDNNSHRISVEVDPQLCERYAGVTLSGITVKESPKWLKNKLHAIGLRPINNIVDVTNYILHETGQPLHAFDLSKIKDNTVKVKTLPEGTSFVTLDGKERKLGKDDIMICNGKDEPMCIAGVFGGEDSGVTENTTDLFLESAVFNPRLIRKSMLLHNLRTDAAVRFEKGINIGLTAEVLKHAADLIKQIAGGKISSDVTDVYPVPREKKEVSLSSFYLKKISGKNYHPDTVKKILTSLNFTILREGIDDIKVAVPYSNPDISIPADVVEEIMRIDGLDQIEIPAYIHLAPSIDENINESIYKEKISGWLTGNGFHEIFTNSITNSDYFNVETLNSSVKIINSISEGLDVMRPGMLPTGLEAIAYNLNRKNQNLLFFEFGKTYSVVNDQYIESQKLALYFSGSQNDSNWNTSSKPVDIYFVKGVVDAIFSLTGIKNYSAAAIQNDELDNCIEYSINKKKAGKAGEVKRNMLNRFSIKQPVYFLSLDWEIIVASTSAEKIVYSPVSRFPQVQRDLSMLINKSISYADIENVVKSLHLKKLENIQLFDVFENEKLGTDKKSLAINFTFLDQEKTLTDDETEAMMYKIIAALETKLNATIRRHA